MKHWLRLAILGTFLITACGKPAEESPQDPETIKKLSSAKDIAGQWTGACSANLDRNLPAKSVKTQLTFTQKDYDEKTDTYKYNDFLELHSAFESTDCSGQPIYFVKSSGAFTVLDDRTESLRKINLARRGIELIPNVGGIVDQLNESEVCGVKDWMIGQARTIGNKICWGVIAYPIAVRYDIFQLQNDDDKLCFGSINDPVNNGSKPSLRPTGLGPCFDVIPTVVN
ncbi:MAG: hypothetical protein ABL958_05290 [Bdellovibrionia bacterium]